MAVNVSNEYEYIDIVNGDNTNRHYLKDKVARNMIVVSDTEPTDENTKIWIKTATDDPIELITREDLESLDGGTNLTNIVPAYDENSFYSYGNVVSYQGKVYKCIANVEIITGAFNPAKWTETDVYTATRDSANQYTNDRFFGSVASRFDPMISYHTGDYVYSNNNLYKFTTDYTPTAQITTAAQQVTLTSQLQAIKNTANKSTNNNYKVCALKPTFIVGRQLSSNGNTASNTKRSVTNDFIHALKGSVIAPNDNTVQYNIAFYQYPRTSSFVSYQSMITDGSSYTITDDCYIKIGIGYKDTSKLADQALASNFTFTLLQPVEPVPFIYNMEPSVIQDTVAIRDFGTTSTATAAERVNALYTAYDNLMALYPHWVSKEILGQDASNTYDIVCYTINSHTDSYYESSTPFVVPHLKILLLTDIHGAEIGIPYDTYKFIKTLLEQHSSGPLARIWEYCTIKIIPTCNPWGYGNKSNFNVNSVNLNRNFPTSDWTASGEVGDADYPGPTGGSEAETQIIMQFIKDNPDACCLFNLHNCQSFSDGHILGYVTSAYDIDSRVALSVFHSLDNICKSTWSYLLADGSNSDQINTYNYNLFRVSNARKVGTMDKWAAWECGVHGYLLETAPTLGDSWNSNNIVDIQNINVTTLTNLIAGVVSQNKDMLTDNTESVLS